MDLGNAHRTHTCCENKSTQSPAGFCVKCEYSRTCASGRRTPRAPAGPLRESCSRRHCAGSCRYLNEQKQGLTAQTLPPCSQVILVCKHRPFWVLRSSLMPQLSHLNTISAPSSQSAALTGAHHESAVGAGAGRFGLGEAEEREAHLPHGGGARPRVAPQQPRQERRPRARHRRDEHRTPNLDLRHHSKLLTKSTSCQVRESEPGTLSPY